MTGMSTVVATPIQLDEQGVAYIEGTTTKVIEVALAKQTSGLSPEELQEELPHLTPPGARRRTARTGEVRLIRNERQYCITKAHAEKFERALAELAQRPPEGGDIDPLVREAIVEGMRSQLAELKDELATYDTL